MDVDEVDEEIKDFRIRCRGPAGQSQPKMVNPVTCRNCSNKRTCPSVQELLAAQRKFSQKYKGTILESSMKMVAGLKTKVANYILNQ